MPCSLSFMIIERQVLTELWYKQFDKAHFFLNLSSNSWNCTWVKCFSPSTRSVVLDLISCLVFLRPIHMTSLTFSRVSIVHESHYCISQVSIFQESHNCVSRVSLFYQSNCTISQVSLFHEFHYHQAMAVFLPLRFVFYWRCQRS